MLNRSLSAFVLLTLSFVVLAEDGVTGPVIENYGPTFSVESLGVDVPVDTDIKYRVVFDAKAHRGKPTDLNFTLESVARFLNMHARSGVPVENLDVVVVLHGQALKSALDQEAYAEHFGGENPSLDMLMQLDRAGVRLFACGQSLGFRGFDKSELASPVKVALSAMTILTKMQQDGYALLL